MSLNPQVQMQKVGHMALPRAQSFGPFAGCFQGSYLWVTSIKCMKLLQLQFDGPRHCHRGMSTPFVSDYTVIYCTTLVVKTVDE